MPATASDGTVTTRVHNLEVLGAQFFVGIPSTLAHNTSGKKGEREIPDDLRRLIAQFAGIRPEDVVDDNDFLQRAHNMRMAQQTRAGAWKDGIQVWPDQSPSSSSHIDLSLMEPNQPALPADLAERLQRAVPLGSAPMRRSAANVLLGLSPDDVVEFFGLNTENPYEMSVYEAVDLLEKNPDAKFDILFIQRSPSSGEAPWNSIVSAATNEALTPRLRELIKEMNPKPVHPVLVRYRSGQLAVVEGDFWTLGKVLSSPDVEWADLLLVRTGLPSVYEIDRHRPPTKANKEGIPPPFRYLGDLSYLSDWPEEAVEAVHEWQAAIEERPTAFYFSDVVKTDKGVEKLFRSGIKRNPRSGYGYDIIEGSSYDSRDPNGAGWIRLQKSLFERNTEGYVFTVIPDKAVDLDEFGGREKEETNLSFLKLDSERYYPSFLEGDTPWWMANNEPSPYLYLLPEVDPTHIANARRARFNEDGEVEWVGPLIKNENYVAPSKRRGYSRPKK